MQAGVALLAGGGWPAVTARGIAERAGSNVGLIHYHFGGLPALRVAIAARAGEMVLSPVVTGLVASRDERAAVEVIRGVLVETAADRRIVSLASALVTGATRERALGDVLRDQLREARGRIAERLLALHPDWSEDRRLGVAALAAALLDGLMLHLIIDPALSAGPALVALGELVDKLQRGS